MSAELPDSTLQQKSFRQLYQEIPQASRFFEHLSTNTPNTQAWVSLW